MRTASPLSRASRVSNDDVRGGRSIVLLLAHMLARDRRLEHDVAFVVASTKSSARNSDFASRVVWGGKIPD